VRWKRRVTTCRAGAVQNDRPLPSRLDELVRWHELSDDDVAAFRDDGGDDDVADLLLSYHEHVLHIFSTFMFGMGDYSFGTGERARSLRALDDLVASMSSSAAAKWLPEGSPLQSSRLRQYRDAGDNCRPGVIACATRNAHLLAVMTTFAQLEAEQLGEGRLMRVNALSLRDERDSGPSSRCAAA
jgi:hypothetical protein